MTETTESFRKRMEQSEATTCKHCAAWRPKKDAPHAFGGCARGGTTTVHYGDTAFTYYTTDTQSCSLFAKAEPAVAEEKKPVRDTWRFS